MKCGHCASQADSYFHLGEIRGQKLPWTKRASGEVQGGAGQAEAALSLTSVDTSPATTLALTLDCMFSELQGDASGIRSFISWYFCYWTTNTRPMVASVSSLVEGVHLCFLGKFKLPGPAHPRKASGNTDIPKGGPMPLPRRSCAMVLHIVSPSRSAVLARDRSTLGIDKTRHTASGPAHSSRKDRREMYVCSQHCPKTISTFLKIHNLNWVRWSTPTISALRKQRQEDCCGFEASLGYLYLAPG